MEPISAALALAPYVPQIVKWITGNDKAEQVANIVVGVAQKVTGDSSVDGAVELIKSDPKLAAEFADRVAEREADLEKAYLADRDSARKMQMVALQQDDLFSKRFVYYFISAWSIFSMIFLFFVTFATIPQQNVRFVDTTLGFLLGTVVASMIAYLLGSTFRSQQKDATIQHLASGK